MSEKWMKKSRNYRLVHTTCLWSDTLQYRTKKRGKSDRFIPNLICPVNANSHVFREKLSFCNRHLNSHAFPPSHDRPLSSPPHINQSMFPNKLICVTYLLSFDFAISIRSIFSSVYHLPDWWICFETAFTLPVWIYSLPSKCVLFQKVLPLLYRFEQS